jgi:hypothetical protein
MSMRQWLVSGLVVGLLVVSAAAMAPVAPAAAATSSPAGTFVTMAGEGDYVFGNRTGTWRPGSGSVTVSGSVTGQVHVTVSGGDLGEQYQLWFAAPPGKRLVPGAYVDAQRTSFRTAEHPGIEIFGDGRGCNETSGRFTVLDAPADLSRLRLVFEQHCEDEEAPALFGEVSYHEPVADRELFATPDRISWPASYRGSSGRVVPVQLTNGSAHELTVSGATVTDGDADFSVVGNSCATLAAGESCSVYVGFRPVSTGPRTGTLTIESSSAQQEQTVALTGDAIPGRTAWDLTSEPSDRFGGGKWHLTPDDTTFFAYGDDHHVYLRAVAKSTGTEWEAHFQAGPGQALLTGATFDPVPLYSNASDAAGLEVGGWRTCNTATGRFTVREASYRAGRVARFLVDFVQHCNDADPALTGTIAWRAADDDETAPVPVTDLSAAVDGDSVDLGWTAPVDDDRAETVVRRVADSSPAATPTAGSAVYHGTRTSATATAIPTGVDQTFTVFSLDRDGNAGQGRSLTLEGTGLTTAVNPTSLVAGRQGALAGRLTDAGAGTALGSRDVEVWSAPKGSGSWTKLATVTTDTTGRYTLGVSPTTTTDYRTTFAGEDGRLGATSVRRGVSVGRLVDLTVNRTSGSRHARFTLGSEVSPAASGAVVTLQRHYSSGWRTVATKRLSSTSKAGFIVRPNRHGRFSYRVRKGADSGHVASVSGTLGVTVR